MRQGTAEGLKIKNALIKFVYYVTETALATLLPYTAALPPATGSSRHWTGATNVTAVRVRARCSGSLNGLTISKCAPCASIITVITAQAVRLEMHVSAATVCNIGLRQSRDNYENTSKIYLCIATWDKHLKCWSGDWLFHTEEGSNTFIPKIYVSVPVFAAENVGSRFVRNVGTYIAQCTASRPGE